MEGEIIEALLKTGKGDANLQTGCQICVLNIAQFETGLIDRLVRTCAVFSSTEVLFTSTYSCQVIQVDCIFQQAISFSTACNRTQHTTRVEVESIQIARLDQEKTIHAGMHQRKVVWISYAGLLNTDKTANDKQNKTTTDKQRKWNFLHFRTRRVSRVERHTLSNFHYIVMTLAWKYIYVIAT